MPRAPENNGDYAVIKSMRIRIALKTFVTRHDHSNFSRALNCKPAEAYLRLAEHEDLQRICLFHLDLDVLVKVDVAGNSQQVAPAVDAGGQLGDVDISSWKPRTLRLEDLIEGVGRGEVLINCVADTSGLGRGILRRYNLRFSRLQHTYFKWTPLANGDVRVADLVRLDGPCGGVAHMGRVISHFSNCLVYKKLCIFYRRRRHRSISELISLSSCSEAFGSRWAIQSYHACTLISRGNLSNKHVQPMPNRTIPILFRNIAFDAGPKCNFLLFPNYELA